MIGRWWRVVVGVLLVGFNVVWSVYWLGQFLYHRSGYEQMGDVIGPEILLVFWMMSQFVLAPLAFAGVLLAIVGWPDSAGHADPPGNAQAAD